MATITSQTTVSIGDATPVDATVDLVLQPSSNGTLALRKLTYPSNTLAPVIYEKNPDDWTNFDITPMIKRPTIGVLQTLADNKITGWLGYARDSSVQETWRGSDTEAPITVDFLRLLYAYYENPPTSGFIQWHPRDRTAAVYNIMIESLTVGGSDIKMNFIAANAGYLLGDVNLKFRIISEV